jgi:hypothetical protein
VRSRTEAPLGAMLIAAVIAAAPLGAQQAAEEPASPPSGPVSPDEIVRVLAKLEADPNIAPTRQAKIPQWQSSPGESKDSGSWGWLKSIGRFFAWIGQLFGWLTASSRVLVWIVAAILIGFLAVFILRLFRSGTLGHRAGTFTAPSFVRDLDIRPESLPPDIGAAALALWQEGNKRAALALLYRGLLSRLVHVHSVPIRDSSTEGDCLALATRHLRAERVAYASKLIRTWQSAVYGGEDIETEVVRMLCAEFSAALDAADAPPPLQEAGQPA